MPAAKNPKMTRAMCKRVAEALEAAARRGEEPTDDDHVGPLDPDVAGRLRLLLEGWSAQTLDLLVFMRAFYDVWGDPRSRFSESLFQPLEDSFWLLEDCDLETPDPDHLQRMREAARTALHALTAQENESGHGCS